MCTFTDRRGGSIVCKGCCNHQYNTVSSLDILAVQNKRKRCYIYHLAVRFIQALQHHIDYGEVKLKIESYIIKRITYSRIYLH